MKSYSIARSIAIMRDVGDMLCMFALGVGIIMASMQLILSIVI